VAEALTLFDKSRIIPNCKHAFVAPAAARLAPKPAAPGLIAGQGIAPARNPG